MLRDLPKELLRTPKASPSAATSTACQNSNKGKSVTFPETSLVTFVPESEHTPRSETNDILNSDQNSSVISTKLATESGQTPTTRPRSEIRKTPCPSISVNGHHQGDRTTLSPDLGAQQSPTTLFEALKREQADRSDSIERLAAEEEWKAAAESYFEHEESARKYRESVYRGRTLAPGIETSVSASNSRRYSAVVQQFMQKNNLLTPLPDTALVTRQADQATAADPSYVSWGSVDFGATDLNRHVPQKSPSSYSQADDSTAANPASAESFKVKSLFTPNQSIAPVSALGHISTSASYTDIDTRSDHPAPAGEALGSSLSSSSDDSSNSSCQDEDCRAAPNMENKGKRNSLWITPPRRPSTVAESSDVGTPALHPSPLRPNHHQVLSISEDSAHQQEKIRAQQRMGAVALIVLGIILVFASIIAILALLV